MSKTRRIVTAIITIIVMICAITLSVSAAQLRLYVDTPYPTTNPTINIKNSMQMNLQKDSLRAAYLLAGVRVDAIEGETNIPPYYTSGIGFRVAITLKNAGIYNDTYMPLQNLLVGSVDRSYFSFAENYYDPSTGMYLDHCDNVTMDTEIFIPVSLDSYYKYPLILPRIELNNGKLIYSTK